MFNVKSAVWNSQTLHKTWVKVNRCCNYMSPFSAANLLCMKASFHRWVEPVIKGHLFLYQDTRCAIIFEFTIIIHSIIWYKYMCHVMSFYKYYVCFFLTKVLCLFVVVVVLCMGNAMVICSGSQYGWKFFFPTPKFLFSFKNFWEIFFEVFFKAKKILHPQK
jgi:hypothetical protein